jgi:flagellar biosynthesis GTPase FlhF
MTCFLDTAAGFCNSPIKSSWSRPGWLQPVCLVLVTSTVTWTVMTAVGDQAVAASARRERSSAVSIASRPGGAPLMAIVSLRSQGITIYDTSGWIMRAPVSSGTTGRETPAGVFSVLQKEVDHHSNLYDDAWMPHMHRITWSGIALHGGPLPGYAASHGCVRLPYDFASRLYDVSKVGMRVIIAPGDVTPVDIAHPALPQSKPGAADAAAARTTEAAEASRTADEAKRTAAAAAREAAQAAPPVHAAEKAQHRAENRLAAAEQAVTSARSYEDRQTSEDTKTKAAESRQKAEDAKAKAAETFAEADKQLVAAKAGQQAKLDAAEAARKASDEAEARRVETAEAARKAARDLEPASVFISRKTQRLYVRQAFQPTLESPVTIQDPDRPIGTHVFTATGRIEGAAELRWNVVSLSSGQHDSRVAAAPGVVRDGSMADVEPAPADAGGARAALDRITIPADVAERISGMISPRSSVIVSDEALSPETGKGTEFVVVMNDQPQGGIKFRRHPSPHRHDTNSVPSPFGFPW